MAGLKKSNRPSVYRIKGEGRRMESWSDWFNGLKIGFGPEADQMPVSTMTGWMPDQSAILVVLIKIGNLGLRLLSVELVDADQVDGQ